MLKVLRSTFPIQVLGKFISLLVAALMAQNMPIDLYGQVAFLFTCATLLSLIQAFGLPRYFVSKLPEVGGPTKSTFLRVYKQLIITLPITFVGLVAISKLGAMSISFIDVILTCSISMLIAASQSFNYAIRSTGMIFRSIALETFLTPFALLTLLLGYFYVLRHENASAYHLLLIYIVGYGVVFIKLVAMSRKFPSKNIHSIPIKELSPFFIITFASAVNISADVFMLGMISGSKQVAYYRVTLQLMTLLTFLQVSINTILMPRFSNAHARSDFVTKKRDYHSARIVNLSYLLIMCCVFFFFGEKIVRILFGEVFFYSLDLLYILAFSLILTAAFGPIGVLMQSDGHSNILSKIMMAGACLNVVLNSILIYFYSSVGAALATSFSNFITVLACYLVYQKSRNSKE